MMFVSYAQNFEDVRLWRALGSIGHGRYLDIGAQAPIVDSVSKAFYLAGWRGVHVEATRVYAQQLRNDRSDEDVIEAAVGDAEGEMTFFEIPDTGLSTGMREIAERHRSQGFLVREIIVPVIPLSHLLGSKPDHDIHWMKIDVEGMEASVLRSWGDSPVRPWVLVIESTYPNTQESMKEQWLDLVLARGYHEVHFDGLSSYFVSDAHPELDDALRLPPNVFDGFTVASHHFTARELLNQQRDHHGTEVEILKQELDEVRRELLLSGQALEMQTAQADARQRALCEEQARREADHRRKSIVAQDEIARLQERIKGQTEHIAEVERRLSAVFQSSEYRIGFKLAKTISKLGLRLPKADDSGLQPGRDAGEGAAAPSVINTPFLVGGRMKHEHIAGTGDPSRPASSLSDLCSLHDADFVRCAYATMLGRQPDPQGEAYFLTRLREGYSKLHLLRQLRQSREGQRHDPGITGLDKALRRDRYVNLPFIDYFVRLITGQRGHKKPKKMTEFRASSVHEFPSFQARRIGSDGEFHVSDFLVFHDLEFVQAVYRALLGRDPDTDGQGYFLHLVRNGVSRKEILYRLIRSPEARSARITVLGLRGYRIHRIIMRVPIVSHIVTATGLLIKCPQFVRDIRAMHNHLYRVTKENSQFK